MSEVLYNRQGQETAKTGVDAKGKPVYVYQTPCTRCGGAGGWKGWPGFTCYKCGGACHFTKSAPLYTKTQLEKLQASQAKRDEKKATKAQEAESLRQLHLETVLKPRFMAEYGILLAEAAPYRAKNPFINDVCEKGLKYFRFTEPQAAALAKAVAKMKAADTAKEAAKSSVFIGQPGVRLRNLKVTVDKAFQFQGQQFATGGYVQYRTANRFYDTGMYQVTLLRDIDGNQIVVKSSSFTPNEGDELEISGTIKELKEREGIKQTILTRVSVK